MVPTLVENSRFLVYLFVDFFSYLLLSAKNKWDTKEGNGKSMKKALYVPDTSICLKSCVQLK